MIYRVGLIPRGNTGLITTGVITTGTTAHPTGPTHPTLRVCITGILGVIYRGMYYWCVITGVLLLCVLYYPVFTAVVLTGGFYCCGIRGVLLGYVLLQVLVLVLLLGITGATTAGTTVLSPTPPQHVLLYY